MAEVINNKSILFIIVVGALIFVLFSSYRCLSVAKLRISSAIPLDFSLLPCTQETSYCNLKELILAIPNLSQEDPKVIKAIQMNHLYPPSPNGVNPKITLGKQPSSRVKKVESLLRKFTDGFFVECGAFDGIVSSQSLWMERMLGWNGLLVEPNPQTFAKLRKNNRKAWSSNLCLSPDTHPKEAQFILASNGQTSGLDKTSENMKNKMTTTQVLCAPIYSLLLALNVSTVDFFSLDVEGKEIEVMDTIPFDKVTVKVWQIENFFVKGGQPALTAFMEKKGFIFYSLVPDPGTTLWYDAIFIHPSIKHLL